MKDNPPIVGWPDWKFIHTVFLWLVAIVAIYLNLSNLLSAERGVDEGQDARQCRCVLQTP